MRIKRIGRRFLPYLLIILAAIVMLWPQLHGHAFVSGYDYYFHMSRTYETAMQIKTGHFSYFLSLFSWNHNARIVNALYGPVGGYVSGLILLLTGSWLRWELTMSFLALVLAGGTMYHLGRYWHVNRSVNLALSILYMLSEPISDYVFNQMFAGFGAALLPLLVLLTSEILTQKDVPPVKFALILVLIVEVHLMTFILSMIMVVPCLLTALYSAHQTRARLFKHLCKGVGLMLILSFNVWGAILEVFGSNFHHIIPTFPGTNLGNKSYSAVLNTYPKTALSQTPSLIGMGIAILIVVAVIMWLFNIHRLNSTINILMLLGIFSIWLSSGYFPWRLVKNHLNFIATLIQFPKRFLPLGLILIYLGFGIVLSRYLPIYNGRKWLKTAGLIFLLCLIGWGWRRNYDTYQRYSNIYNSSQVINWHHFVNMKWQKKGSPKQLRNELSDDQPGQFLSQVDSPVPDYLPTGLTYRRPAQYKRLNPQGKYQRTYIAKPSFKWTPLNRNRERITLLTRYRQMRTLPFAKYAHTRMILNGRPVKPKINQVGAIRLRLKPGRNQLKIRYQPSWRFRIGMLISILTWLGLLGVTIDRKFE